MSAVRAQCEASPFAVHLPACDGLAAAAERGNIDGPDVQPLILQTTGDAAALQAIARRWLGVVPGMGVEPIRPLPRSGGF